MKQSKALNDNFLAQSIASSAISQLFRNKLFNFNHVCVYFKAIPTGSCDATEAMSRRLERFTGNENLIRPHAHMKSVVVADTC